MAHSQQVITSTAGFPNRSSDITLVMHKLTGRSLPSRNKTVSAVNCCQKLLLLQTGLCPIHSVWGDALGHKFISPCLNLLVLQPVATSPRSFLSGWHCKLSCGFRKSSVLILGCFLTVTASSELSIRRVGSGLFCP